MHVTGQQCQWLVMQSMTKVLNGTLESRNRALYQGMQSHLQVTKAVGLGSVPTSAQGPASALSDRAARTRRS